MNCHEYDGDIVDLARGVDPGDAVKARVAEHLKRCPRCAGRFSQEQDLTAGLSMLASSAPEPQRAAALEQELLLAFAARRVSARRSILGTPGARRLLAAAAVLVLAVAGWLGLAPWQRAGEHARPAEAGRHDTSVRDDAGGPGRVAAQAVPASGDAAIAPRGGREAVASAVQTSIPRKARAAINSGRVGGDDEVLRFVTLPSAAGLPGIESGRVVRVELPMAILPAYGLDVEPGEAGRVVEADVLVGQDGQPRAIRFVNLDSDSRRRQ